MRSSRRAPVSARPSPICCPCCCSNGARSSRPARTRCRTSCSVATCRCSAPSSAGRCEVAVLKGRGNYLCWHRLDAALRDGTRDATTIAALQALDSWGQASDTRRPHGARGSRRGSCVARPGHIDRRQLLGQGMRVRRSLFRRRGAPPRAGRRGRDRQSSLAARGSRAEGLAGSASCCRERTP